MCLKALFNAPEKRWAACCEQVECSAGREHHGALTACVKRTAEESMGEEVLLLAVDALSQAAQSLEQVLLKPQLCLINLLLLLQLQPCRELQAKVISTLRVWGCRDCHGASH